MQVHITGRHFDVSDAIREYATEKAEKLQRIYDAINEVEIVMKGDDRTFHCEWIVHLQNAPHVVIDVTHESMYAAVDVAADKAMRQVRRQKEKLTDRRHGQRNGGAPVPAPGSGAPDEATED